MMLMDDELTVSSGFSSISQHIESLVSFSGVDAF